MSVTEQEEQVISECQQAKEDRAKYGTREIVFETKETQRAIELIQKGVPLVRIRRTQSQFIFCFRMNLDTSRLSSDFQQAFDDEKDETIPRIRIGADLESLKSRIIDGKIEVLTYPSNSLAWDVLFHSIKSAILAGLIRGEFALTIRGVLGSRCDRMVILRDTQNFRQEVNLPLNQIMMQRSSESLDDPAVEPCNCYPPE